MDNYDILKNNLIKAFSGKMEKKEALIMQFAMSIIEKGEKPPPKDEVEQAIKKLILEGILEEKDDLLILLKKPDTSVLPLASIDVPIKTDDSINLQNYTPTEKMILEGFSGKYENEQALLMQIVMNFAQKGEKPPSKEEFKETVDNLIDKEVLQRSGANLIKKI